MQSKIVRIDSVNEQRFEDQYGDVRKKLVITEGGDGHYQNRRIRSDHTGKLAGCFSLNRVDHVSDVPEERTDLADMGDPCFRSLHYIEPRDTTTFRNVAIYYGDAQYTYNSFFKNVLRKDGDWERISNEILPETTIRVFAPVSKKGGFITCFTVVAMMYSYFIALSKSIVELQRVAPNALDYARTVLLGNPSEFLRYIKSKGQALSKIAEDKGLVLSCMLNQFINATGLQDELGYKQGKVTLPSTRLLTIGSVGKVILRDMPEEGTFYIRSESFLLFVRSLGKDLHGNQHIKYVQVPLWHEEVQELQLGQERDRSYFMAS